MVEGAREPSAPRRRCLVFGGTGAVGRAVCEALIEASAEVFFTYFTNQSLAGSMQAASPHLHPLQADLRRSEDIARVVSIALGRRGSEGRGEESGEGTGEGPGEKTSGLDAFVHCAGLGFTSTRSEGDGPETLGDIDEQAWDRLFTLNVKSAFLACKHLAPVMMQQGHGQIVLLGSIDGAKPVPAPVHYAASKGALLGMTRTLAKELGPRGVRVNMVAPGVLDAGIGQGLPLDLRNEYLKHCGLKRFGRPSEVASFVAWLVMENSYVTGQTLLLDGAL